ncbi:MAG: hypothetical protein ACU84J_05965 [Gammaproteobacteria bacterium]
MKAISNKPQTPTAADKKPPVEDERYPGSFFKIPGRPITGTTGWRIS